jgi:hypothetical protein
MRCGGRGSVGRASVVAGRALACERSTAPRRTMLMRTAKPCGPGTRCWCQVGGGFSNPTGHSKRLQSADDGDKTNSSPGRARHKSLKPLRRKRRVFRGTCGDYRVLTTNAHGLCGCSGHPAFPAPSVFLGERFKRPGRIAPRGRGVMFGHRHCERSEAIHFAAQRKNGLLPPSPMSYGGQVVASLLGMTVLQSRRLWLFEN